MKPVRLELEGFLSYAEPTSIEFAGVEAIAVVGENGAGKTALLEAITWALYGITRARSADEVVNDSSTSARVSFEFELGAGPSLGAGLERYRVVRERHSGRSGKSELRLEHQTGVIDDAPRETWWEPVGGDKITDTELAIEELLGMSPDLFVSTAFVGQGDADRFTELRPAARKALLFELLELGHYEALARAAHDEAQIHTAAIGKLEARRDTLSEGLEDPDALAARRDGAKELYGAMRADRDDLREHVAAARRTLEEARTHVSGADTARERLSQMRAERERRAAAARTSLEALERTAAELEEQGREAAAGIAREEAQASRHAEVEARATEAGNAAQGRREALERALREHEQAAVTYARAAERAKLLEERWESTSGGTCPTCGRPHSEEQIARLDHELAEARADAESFGTEAHRLGSILENAKADLTHTGDELAAATEEVAGIRKAIANLETWRTRRAFVSEHLEQVARDVSRNRADVAELSGPSEEELELEHTIGSALEAAGRMDALEDAVTDLERREGERDKELEIAAETVARLSERLDDTRRRHDELAAVVAELVDLGHVRARYRILEEAFGRDGIPAELLRRSTSELERESNEILERLTAGRYTLSIETERALRSGRAAETLDVIVSDDRADRPLEALSGGERQAVDIALRLGLSRILAARAGHPVELLVLDETFAAFDSARRQAAVELLAAVRDRFGAVVFVTHDRALAEAFPRRLFVERVGETSRARLE